MKDQLIFNIADTDANSDNVGAFVRSADGTLITHTNVSSQNGLDVNIINTDLTVSATNLDIRDLLYTQDSVTAYQGGTWTIDSITNDVNVTATNLDIRDLSAASDSVAAWLSDGSGNAITSTGGSLDVNVTSGVNVEVDLSHVDDSVRLGDGTNFLTSTTIGSDIGLDVNVINDTALANTAIAADEDVLAVADTAQATVASPLSDRKYLFIYNEGSKKVYIGPSGVTAANGFPLSSGSYLQMRAGASVGVSWIGSSGSTGSQATIRTMELS